jgi:16S rRNA (guanine966-N2)-methyltransferase
VPDKRRGSTGPPGQIRIIAGKWRGRRIPVLDSEGLRPTGDRARETLFNWLAGHLSGADCLDLFAGTGALDLEALSRGARTACFVERESRVAEQLSGIIRTLGAEGAEVLCFDAVTFLRGAKRAFDIVFVDPPFAGPDHGELCTLLAQGWLRDCGWVYLEMGRDRGLPDLPAGWQVHRENTAGQVRFALVRVGTQAGRRDGPAT